MTPAAFLASNLSRDVKFNYQFFPTRTMAGTALVLLLHAPIYDVPPYVRSHLLCNPSPLQRPVHYFFPRHPSLPFHHNRTLPTYTWPIIPAQPHYCLHQPRSLHQPPTAKTRTSSTKQHALHSTTHSSATRLQCDISTRSTTQPSTSTIPGESITTPTHITDLLRPGEQHSTPPEVSSALSLGTSLRGNQESFPPHQTPNDVSSFVISDTTQSPVTRAADIENIDHQLHSLHSTLLFHPIMHITDKELSMHDKHDRV
ncbi:hypothetical protein SARC_05398 [Sphaeroforma arctica JP610]|uniref:Uncharacterized protein n=1 Tax=Sphaeroforma arctica JP610 TaxID=667725 RepID=A0A0L0G0E0_9EUKA|nr:hypothetical protein SARC_05398 [Sphaeroforma arctica JP610]KNC82306.1 hypothetical protein SARC_05398 [Sphaeroforma arctica JP610]|eukprot:XP_014156208.1 hypothetical protein SARC_05398 [Sphaeroforma arctica JP610]